MPAPAEGSRKRQTAISRIQQQASSPAQSPISPPSPSSTDSSADDLPNEHLASASRPGSPSVAGNEILRQEDSEDSVTCQWDDCGQIFTHLPTLIDHIHNDHIGVHKSNYTCEWSSCQRRGLAQTSRFALISHIRSHTGEKPFVCARPECDKSFTRSDALAKHMRLQHNISPPAPGRGGSRKRKRNNEETANGASAGGPTAATSATGAFTTFKVESTDPLDPNRRSLSPYSANFGGEPELPNFNDDDDSSDGTLPEHLQAHYDPATNLVMDRSPAMVMYILMKAKQKYALEQHDQLLEELRVAKEELKTEKDKKEAMLDSLLKVSFGQEADSLVSPVELPASMLPPPLAPNPPTNQPSNPNVI